MNVNILASGSGGNCIAVSSGSTTILIDVGIPKTEIEKRLLDTGIRPDMINAIFVTHAHNDHIQGLPLANKYHIPVYAGTGEWRNIKSVDGDLKKILGYGERAIIINNVVVGYFPVYHDAYEPLGYTMETLEEEKVSVCLDTGKVDNYMVDCMKNSNIYVIEANHDPDILMASEYPESVKERIMSERGHLSNQQAAEALSKLVRGNGEMVYLTHLSRTNNIPELAKMTVESALRRSGFTNGKDYFLEVV